MVKLKKFESWTSSPVPQTASLAPPMTDDGFARSKYNDSEIKNLISNDRGIRSHLKRLSFDEKLSLLKELYDFRNSISESNSNESDSRGQKLVKILSKYSIPISAVVAVIGTINVMTGGLSFIGLIAMSAATGIFLGICQLLAEDEQ